jgi:thiamine biosynthesis lipoprotein
VQSLARLAMRTRFEIVIADEADPAHLRSAGEAALAEVDDAETLLSAYRDDAHLFRVNALAGRQAVRVDARLLAVLARAMDQCIACDGAFDLALGALLQAWNLAGMADGTEVQLPGEDVIQAALGQSGMRRHLHLDAERTTVRFSTPGLRLDAGAIGKGYALEQSEVVLRGLGIRSALMHGGTSTVCALGSAPDASPWRVAIRHPVDGHAHIATAALRDTSMSVSAVHGRSVRIAGRRFGHVIDPRSGWPVDGNLLAAVMHPSALVSDSWSTALLVLGSSGLQALSQRCPEASFLLVRREDQGQLAVDIVGRGFARQG